MRYAKWIAENVKGSALGRCKEVSLEMQKAFPELLLVRGHYYDPVWGERMHWWLKTEDGEIIDPTKSQFPSKGEAPYIEWIEGSKEPVGKCMNCGEYCYDDPNVCSTECSELLMARY